MLSTFGSKHCADQFLLHDFKIVMLKYGQIFVFMKILALNIQLLLLALSPGTIGFLNDAYSHKWCHSETCLYMIYKEYVSRDKSLTSDHEIRLDPFKCLFFGATQAAF